ncbi:RNA polymerase subunit sigma-70 [Opitutaceae bacterium EW11]|nr:RNA polymerase subunit sigma-70 [Opitutaceae bacterium EW11]
MGEPDAHQTIEYVARNSYGRLVAYLAARSGDVAGAEDALSEAFGVALQRWPEEGVPLKPEAWLLHAARNRLIDASRRRQVRQKSEPYLQQLAGEAESLASAEREFPDERLKLLFVCAHPAIDETARTPLMLQTVLGLDAARIASAFLVSPAAMGQRLVRAKTKIRDAGIPFTIPEPPEWDERVSFVLDALYSAYTAGWESVADPDSAHRGLAAEAISVGRTLVQLMPEEPEARGLLALMLHCEARSAARHTSTGEFVPLDRQDPALWSRTFQEEAEKHLRVAAACRHIGRYQLEAALQSVHAHRAVSGEIDWKEIALLYEGLVRLAPGIGSSVGRAVALAECGDAAGGLAALDAIPASRVASYQPWWAARAHLLQKLNRGPEARTAFLRAASLSEDPSQRAHLLRRAES